MNTWLDDLWQDWQRDPASVPPEWAREFEAAGRSGGAGQAGAGASASPDHADKQGWVTTLMRAYRDLGYLYADLNPLKGYLTPDMYYRLFAVEGDTRSLDLSGYHLGPADLDTEFHTGRFMKPERQTLRNIVDHLSRSYCSTLGLDISHIQNRVIRRWFFERLEGGLDFRPWTAAELKGFQEDMLRAEGFELFLHEHYMGQKRFSLEGSEVMVPALNTLKACAAREGASDIVMGMAHRGRLNLLVNVLAKPLVDVFAKFEDAYTPHQYGGNGDVKYHMGYDSHWTDPVSGRTIKLSLLANPSHLEAVDPVVEGRARALQRLRGDQNRKRVIPVLLHGDSAFSGQGVVTETLNLSQLQGYRTGGTIHILVNNQIGFTTAGRDSRSTYFASDTGKTIPMPILHVNGDDTAMVCHAMALAFDFRQKFGMDILVDVICYRRHGHNETDEPSFTHPRMYQLIRDRPGLPTLMGTRLADEGTWDLADQDRFRAAWRSLLQAQAERARSGYVPRIDDAFLEGRWKGFTRAWTDAPLPTGMDKKALDPLVESLHRIPPEFALHPKLAKILAERATLWSQGQADWSLGEALAFASLLVQGHAVRLSGEDAQRGTFSHRHAVWWDHSAARPRPWKPLSALAPDQAPFTVHDSPLSEFSVLGFEYGYSITNPRALVIWEAQFGDFANGAQVIIDQFIVSGESKWFRSSGLVLLLPHGYEGQGPEHSSAHVDRWLSRCADNNMVVVNPGSPAQLFHVLRRQALAPWRKPLIVFSPKGLLRHKACRSRVEDLAVPAFRPVVTEPGDLPADARVALLCSGRVWYDLRDTLASKGDKGTVGTNAAGAGGSGSIALIRIDQLHPFPAADLASILAGLPPDIELRWVQEENRNYGAWSFVREQFDTRPELARFGAPVYTGRPPSPSPATGSHHQHEEELEAFLAAAVAPRAPRKE